MSINPQMYSVQNCTLNWDVPFDGGGVMSRDDDGEIDEGGEIVDCQGSNPASPYNFESNSTQILQSSVFL